MKKILAIAGFAAALLFAPPVLATGMFQPDGVSAIDPQGGDQGPQRMQLPPDPEGKAADLRVHGKCDQAIPILRTLTYNERDDIAKFNLGQCLVDVGRVETDTARAARDKHEGAQWLLRAANRGLPNAQAGLVSVYLNGDGVPRDPVEAAKWALLYHSNGTRLAIGMQDIPSDLQARLDAALNDRSWDEAQERADNWSPENPPGED